MAVVGISVIQDMRAIARTATSQSGKDKHGGEATMQLSFEGEGGYLEGEKVPAIYAVDDQDETWYVLIRHGCPPVAAAWPSMLKDLCPSAIMGGTLGTGSTHERMGEVNGHLEDYVGRVLVHGPGGGNKQVWGQGLTSP